jgi:uncharacterized membrane protein YidH (DUF202 family)
MPHRSLGLTIIVLGVLAVVVGVLLAAGALNWFGRLPGDIRVERPNVRFYAPITSMLLVSVGVSALLFLVRRFMGR